MEIDESKLYINKTWTYLAPCLRGHGDEFVKRFNPISKLALGIHDTLLDGADIAQGRNIFILCDKGGNHKTFENFFLEFIRDKDYFVIDYCPDSNFLSSNRHMIVISIPEGFENAYDHFVKGEYSQMYSPLNLESLFPVETKRSEYLILSRNAEIEDEMIEKINKEFKTSLKITDFEDRLEEFDLPLKAVEEIFNYTGNKNLFVNSNFKQQINI